jgi:oxygen-dependent protoporphyrinogen oxidase
MKPLDTKQIHVIVIGGGITGLSAAWELQKRRDLDLKFTVLESTDRWGGKIVTATIPGPEGGEFVIDGGPESFITRKPEVWELAHELGIEDQIIDPGSETRNMYVLEEGKPISIPLNPIAFLTSPLMSTRGKLRMLMEPFIEAKQDDEDESLASFVNRRLGNEALEKFIGPILAGIYNTDPNTQSILTTSPIMREMEKEYGGLFKAVVGRMRSGRKNTNNHRPPRFITFKYGAQILVDRCVEQLEGDLVLNAQVSNIEKNANQYKVKLSDGMQYHADALIIATTANMAAELLYDAAPEASVELSRIRHENIGTISLVYRNEDLPADLNIHGLMVPRREKRAVDAVTFTSKKLDIRAPQDYALVRVFFGGSSPQVVAYTDTELLDTIRKELRDILNIQANPLEAIIFRWPAGFPQADVGHLAHVQSIVKMLPNGIHLASSSYRGIGVPDCIRQGREAARHAILNLNGNRPDQTTVS